ncbi:MFS transporter [Chromobacterium haemolyticum]|nr:MFS transporter [Chromobacterium haemolyticum]
MLLAGGVAAFCAQAGTEPPVHPETGERHGSVASLAGMQVLILALVALGAIAGAVDVISVAFAQQQGQPAAASIVLSVYAIGSCLAGLLFGARKLNMPLPRLFVRAAAATALATLPLLLVSNLWLLTAGVLLAGVFFAPTMIVAMGLVEEMVPPTQLTEGLTWLITGLASGVALGAAVTGWVVDHAGVRAGFCVTLAAGVLMALIALVGQKRIASHYLQEKAA